LTIRFAHIADTHLGAFRDPILRRLNLDAFLKALRAAEEEAVDFVVIAGDLFDSPLPDMTVVQEASDALWRLRSSGVRIYVFHGSHDRSPTESGIVDVLAATRLFELVDVPDEDGITPALVVDGPTGALIAAVGGMRGGLEREVLVRASTVALKEAARDAPLAIFGFHGAVGGMLPEGLAMLESVPQGKLPGGFDYYALGHVHHRTEATLDDGTLASYPGPTFGATFTDIADMRPKGFTVVEADDQGHCRTTFVPIETAPVALLDIDAEGGTSMGVQGAMMDLVEAEGWEGRVVLLRVHGTLRQGRPAEIGIPAAREVLLDRGALAVYVSRAGLRGADSKGAGTHDPSGEGTTDPILVANRIIARRVGEHETKLKWLSGGDGELFARDLLEVLKRERGSRKVDDHKEALLRDSLALMGIPEMLGGDGA
jgi:hypothetical protein